MLVDALFWCTCTLCYVKELIKFDDAVIVVAFNGIKYYLFELMVPYDRTYYVGARYYDIFMFLDYLHCCWFYYFRLLLLLCIISITIHNWGCMHDWFDLTFYKYKNINVAHAYKMLHEREHISILCTYKIFIKSRIFWYALKFIPRILLIIIFMLRH